MNTSIILVKDKYFRFNENELNDETFLHLYLYPNPFLNNNTCNLDDDFSFSLSYEPISLSYSSHQLFTDSFSQPANTPSSKLPQMTRILFFDAELFNDSIDENLYKYVASTVKAHYPRVQPTATCSTWGGINNRNHSIIPFFAEDQNTFIYQPTPTELPTQTAERATWPIQTQSYEITATRIGGYVNSPKGTRSWWGEEPNPTPTPSISFYGEKPITESPKPTVLYFDQPNLTYPYTYYEQVISLTERLVKYENQYSYTIIFTAIKNFLPTFTNDDGRTTYTRVYTETETHVPLLIKTDFDNSFVQEGYLMLSTILKTTEITTEIGENFVLSASMEASNTYVESYITSFSKCETETSTCIFENPENVDCSWTVIMTEGSCLVKIPTFVQSKVYNLIYVQSASERSPLKEIISNAQMILFGVVFLAVSFSIVIVITVCVNKKKASYKDLIGNESSSEINNVKWNSVNDKDVNNIKSELVDYKVGIFSLEYDHYQGGYLFDNKNYEKEKQKINQTFEDMDYNPDIMLTDTVAADDFKWLEN